MNNQNQEEIKIIIQVTFAEPMNNKTSVVLYEYDFCEGDRAKNKYYELSKNDCQYQSTDISIVHKHNQ